MYTELELEVEVDSLFHAVIEASKLISDALSERTQIEYVVSFEYDIESDILNIEAVSAQDQFDVSLDGHTVIAVDDEEIAELFAKQAFGELELNQVN